MKVNITVDIIDIGNARRGYHNYDTTVQFQYEDDSRYVEGKEHEIVNAIVGKPDSWMWHSVKNTEDHVWKANYGYDSGD